VDAIFTPYHDRIHKLLDQRAARRTMLVAMHSFTPRFKGESRAMHVGVLYYRKTRLAEIMLDLLRREGDIEVGDNAPYAITENSDYSIPTHGERRGLEHVEIEIRQDLIETEDGQNAWAERFARLLTAAEAALKA
jgi:predicted N-formylglutamate amidohydrolase